MVLSGYATAEKGLALLWMNATSVLEVCHPLWSLVLALGKDQVAVAGERWPEKATSTSGREGNWHTPEICTDVPFGSTFPARSITFVLQSPLENGDTIWVRLAGLQEGRKLPSVAAGCPFH